MLIAIEGIDGSGKGTQAKILTDTLYKQHKNVQLFSFPYYTETFFGNEVGKYLNGKFGQLDDVPAEFASLLYAGDRFEKKQEIMDHLSQGSIVICDRYVPSNLAHQTAKLPKGQQKAMREWITHVEYTIFGMPKPDLTVLLNLPPHRSKEFVLRKKARAYTAEKLDLHESASGYLEKVSEVYVSLAYESNWHIIDCEQDGRILSIEEVAENIFSTVMQKYSSLS